MSARREVISTKNAPEAIGPYSQAIKCGDMLFVSGQIGIDPETGTLSPDGIKAQTDRALGNLKAIVEASGLGLDDVVKTTCFLKDMGDFPIFNSVYETYFPMAPPARETVGVAGLPKGALVEVSCIAAARRS